MCERYWTIFAQTRVHTTLNHFPKRWFDWGHVYLFLNEHYKTHDSVVRSSPSARRLDRRSWHLIDAAFCLAASIKCFKTAARRLDRMSGHLIDAAFCLAASIKCFKKAARRLDRMSWHFIDAAFCLAASIKCLKTSAQQLVYVYVHVRLGGWINDLGI